MDFTYIETMKMKCQIAGKLNCHCVFETAFSFANASKMSHWVGRGKQEKYKMYELIF